MVLSTLCFDAVNTIAIIMLRREQLKGSHRTKIIISVFFFFFFFSRLKFTEFKSTAMFGCDLILRTWYNGQS